MDATITIAVGGVDDAIGGEADATVATAAVSVVRHLGGARHVHGRVGCLVYIGGGCVILFNRSFQNLVINVAF